MLEHCLDGQLLWFCLLIFILIRWHVQIHHIMDAIARRVADGEEFSLGPLHLGSVDDQRRGLEIRERVIAELIEVDDSPISRPAENEE